MRDLRNLAALAAASYGLDASFLVRTDAPKRHRPNLSALQRIIFDDLPRRDHITSEKPLTKRQRRRLRGKDQP